MPQEIRINFDIADTSMVDSGIVLKQSTSVILRATVKQLPTLEGYNVKLYYDNILENSHVDGVVENGEAKFDISKIITQNGVVQLELFLEEKGKKVASNIVLIRVKNSIFDDIKIN